MLHLVVWQRAQRCCLDGTCCLRLQGRKLFYTKHEGNSFFSGKMGLVYQNARFNVPKDSNCIFFLIFDRCVILIIPPSNKDSSSKFCHNFLYEQNCYSEVSLRALCAEYVRPSATCYQRIHTVPSFHEIRYKKLSTQQKFRENTRSDGQKLLKDVNEFLPNVLHFLTDFDEIWNRESSRNTVEYLWV
jgi:hypothetical protein